MNRMSHRRWRPGVASVFISVSVIGCAGGAPNSSSENDTPVFQPGAPIEEPGAENPTPQDMETAPAPGDGMQASEGNPGDRPRTWDVLADECFSAWGALLDDEQPADLDSLLPALVGPLDDKNLRDALIAWLCPGWLAADVDDRLRGRLNALGSPAGQPEQPAQGEHTLADQESAPEVDDFPCEDRRVEHALEALCRATPTR